MPHHVFISYGAGDRTAADAICTFLEKQHIRCWQSPRDLPVEGDFARATAEALTQSSAVVILLSSASNQSRYVKRDLVLASNKNIPIFRFRIDNSKPAEVFRYVSVGQAEINATEALAPGLVELAAAIRHVLDQPAEPTRPVATATGAGPTGTRAVFISWCSLDEAAAIAIVDQLEQAGIKCWISNRDVSANYQREIANAMRVARAMVLVLSNNVYNAEDQGSDQILKEIALADRYHLRIFPLRIEACEPRGAYEFELANRQYFDLFRNREANWQRLLSALSSTVA
jgi:hypothetical protein